MPGGMIIGTCSAPQPIPGFTDSMNIDVAKAYSTGDYQGYMLADTLVSSIFDSVPSGFNSWRWTTCTESIRYLCGSDLNDPAEGGNPDDPYVILQICKSVLAPGKNVYIGLDDISIVIY